MIERARASSSTAHQLPSVHISTSHRSHDQLGIVYDSDAQMVLDAELDSINLNGIVVVSSRCVLPHNRLEVDINFLG